MHSWQMVVSQFTMAPRRDSSAMTRTHQWGYLAILYECFFQTVVGDDSWKRRFAENKGFGTNVSEAFTLHGCMITKNNNPGCTLLTEYNLAEQENEDSNDNDDKQIFCRDLDEIEIALPNDDGDDYVLVFNEGPTKEQAKAAAEEVRKNALANVSNQHHMQSYKKVKSMLMADTLTTTMPEMTSQLAAKEFTKKKRKSMMEIKKYTGSASKKTKRDSHKFKGLPKEGKQKGTATSARVGPRKERHLW